MSDNGHPRNVPMIPLETWSRSQPNKRPRHATGSASTVGGVSPKGDIGNVNSPHFNTDILNSMSADEKLNLIINNMSELKVLNSKIMQVHWDNFVTNTHIDDDGHSSPDKTTQPESSTKLC